MAVLSVMLGVGKLAKGREKLPGLIVNQAGRIIGEPRQKFDDIYADLLITKLIDVMDDATCHYNHDRLAGQLISRSGPSAVTGRYLSSFLPQAIRIHNANFETGTVSIDV